MDSFFKRINQNNLYDAGKNVKFLSVIFWKKLRIAHVRFLGTLEYEPVLQCSAIAIADHNMR